MILENPDFVLADAELMQALLAPMRGEAQADGRRVFDLRAALIERLQRRLSRLAEAHRDIIDAAWDSLHGADQVHQAALAVMDCEDVGGLSDLIRARFAGALDVSAARLRLERPVGVAAPRRGPAATSTLQSGFIRNRLVGPSLLDGRLLFMDVDNRPTPPGVDEAVFDLAADDLGSAVYVLLGGDGATARGVLALGATDRETFCAGRNADLYKFLGAVVERRLKALDPTALARAAS